MQILGMGTDGLWKKLCMKAIDFMRERYFKGVIVKEIPPIALRKQ